MSVERPQESLAVRALSRLADIVYRHPGWVFYPQLILAVLCVFYTLNQLQFSTSRNDLVDTSKGYHSNFLTFKREFKAQDEIVAVVESENLEKNRQFVERLGAKLDAKTNVFTDVFFKGDLTILGPKALLFLPEETLGELHQTLREYRPFLQNFVRATNLVALVNLVNRQFASAGRQTNSQTESLLKALPALERILSQASDSLIRPGAPPSPGINALFNSGPAAEREIYITFEISPFLKAHEVKDLRRLLVRLRQATEPELRELLARLPADLRQEIERYSPQKKPRASWADRVLPELNTALKGPLLTEAGRAGNRLDSSPSSDPAKGAQNTTAAQNRRVLNRLLTPDTLLPWTENWFYLVSARARSEDLNEAAVLEFRKLLKETKREVAGVNADITGEPVLEVDEMSQSQQDTTLATIVSLVIVALIFIFGYNETGRPIKATICLIIGLMLTMGFTTLAVGHLNILTITFAPMLIGLAIDFGVHLITRYEEELRHGESKWVALRRGMVNTGLGIFTGAFTTAGAFLAMAITDFKGVREMGIITGGGLLVCLIPMVTMLPVLLVRGRQNVVDHLLSPEVDKRARIENLWLNRPVTVAVLTVTLCALSATQFRKLYFDYNLLNMQSPRLAAVVFEKKLIDSASKSVLYGAVIAKSVPEAVALERRLTNLTTVAHVDSMGGLLHADPTGKLAVIREIKQEVATINFLPVDPTPVKVSELSQTLWSFEGYLGLAIDEVRKENEPDLLKQLENLRATVHVFGQRLASQPRPQASEKIAAFQRALFNDIRATFDILKNQDSTTGLKVADLPPALQNRFVGASGQLLLQVYPKENVWDRKHQREFVEEVRTVDPLVTGTPVQLLEYTSLLKNSYIEAAWYSLAAISLLILLHFRSILSVILALVPVLVGTIWMLGLMGLLKIPFNPANIMTLPLVIGIGVTNGIHILNRFAEEQNPGILAKSTGKAVFVSGLTTIAGFGSLMLAKHEGIRSLGYLMSIGVTTCMVAGLTFLPALLKLMLRAGWEFKKKTQWR